MIKVKSKGDYKKITDYLVRVKKPVKYENLRKLAEEGVIALTSATPVDTGKTALSWYYQIVDDGAGRIKIRFCNSNIIKDYANIAILLQYGHATRNGGWVEGRDYINPAIQPVFDRIAKDAWEEVTRNE